MTHYWLRSIHTMDMSEFTIPVLTIKPCILMEYIKQGETS